MERLLAHIDGNAVRGIQEHLARCAHCSDTVALLSAARGPYPSQTEHTATLLNEARQALQVQMNAWRTLRERTPQGCVHITQRRSHRLFHALAFYFGDEVARRLDCGARWDATEDLLVSSAKPFFAAFLGRRAAEALAREISA
jgi:hypothetical protein